MEHIFVIGETVGVVCIQDEMAGFRVLEWVVLDRKPGDLKQE
jgi:hypothetical protein